MLKIKISKYKLYETQMFLLIQNQYMNNQTALLISSHKQHSFLNNN